MGGRLLGETRRDFVGLVGGVWGRPRGGDIGGRFEGDLWRGGELGGLLAVDRWVVVECGRTSVGLSLGSRCPRGRKLRNSALHS